ncbi:unnamed protein product, partial [Aphanomyces euteiches]
MLESKLEANNATLIRQLMSMMRKTEDAKPSLPEDDGGPWDFEDEPAPVGVAEDRMWTLRLMPVEPLTIFDGEFSDRNTADTWLRKFEETSYACQWSDEETRRRFRLYTTKYVQEWVSQLEGPQKRTWRQLRQSFMKEYVQSAIDQEDLYYCSTKNRTRRSEPILSDLTLQLCELEWIIEKVGDIWIDISIALHGHYTTDPW